jgi:hypothetical protein
MFFGRLREPVERPLWANPDRERSSAETMLGGASGVLFVALLADRFGELRLGLLDPRGDWLSLLPALWLALTCWRSFRGLPFDRISVGIGFSGFLPYLAFGGRSSAYRPPFPERWWLGFTLFSLAFLLGFILERRTKAS